MTLPIIQTEIITPLLQLAVDPIPNIRFNVAKALEVLATSVGDNPEGEEFVRQKIFPVLEQQKNDGDADVRYFSTRALQKALSVIEKSGRHATPSRIDHTHIATQDDVETFSEISLIPNYSSYSVHE